MKNVAIAIGLVFGLVVGTGCSVGIETPTPLASAHAQTVPTPSLEPSAADTDAPAGEPSEVKITVSASGDSNYSASGEARRSVYADDIDVTMGCPTGELVLDQDYQTVRINQDCAKITVAADYVDVLAEHVDSVIVSAGTNSALVLVRSADSVVLSGDYADVYWDEGTPAKIRITGEHCTANPNPAPEP